MAFRRLKKLVLSATLLMLVSCGDSSPTTPGESTGGPPSGTVSISIVDPQGLLVANHARIRELVEQTLDQAESLFAIGRLSITVSASANRAIPGYGVGGFAPDGFTMQIDIDPQFPGLVDVLSDRLPPIVAHELHHNMRWRGPGYGSTLLQSMVSEGLADHFAIELLGAPVPPWSNAFARDQTEHYLEQARPELDSTSFNRDAWFFGTGGLPRWTGYTLGFRIVEDYQAANPGLSAAELVNTPAEAFRPE